MARGAFNHTSTDDSYHREDSKVADEPSRMPLASEPRPVETCQRDKIEELDERTRRIEAKANELAERLAREAARQVAKRASIERIEEALCQQELQLEHEEQRIQDELYAEPTSPQIPIRAPEPMSTSPKHAPAVTEPPISPACSTRGLDPPMSPARSALELEDHPPRSPAHSARGIDDDAPLQSPACSNRGLDEPFLSAGGTNHALKSPSKGFLSFGDNYGTGIMPKQSPSRLSAALPSVNFTFAGSGGGPGGFGGFGQSPTVRTNFRFGTSPTAGGFGFGAGPPPSATAGDTIGFGAASMADTGFGYGATSPPFGSVMNTGYLTTGGPSGRLEMADTQPPTQRVHTPAPEPESVPIPVHPEESPMVTVAPRRKKKKGAKHVKDTPTPAPEPTPTSPPPEERWASTPGPGPEQEQEPTPTPPVPEPETWPEPDPELDLLLAPPVAPMDVPPEELPTVTVSAKKKQKPVNCVGYA
ncbi:hypothetical protein M408DRAFT_330238 [Serendipita vermifera MAFF 305830]|uniref:Uncharacterized protein n=1 Tax=Serendipita vermifera MAFF 305830 TaxID=933852 RepID=A0A0C3B4M9_SERVB|nr:hypothetical protein M408DRAFT_330238 [Serendipita vermifera MAFF 305830]